MVNLQDSLVNLVSGLGTSRDKSSYSEFRRLNLTQDYLGILYNHWIFSKAVNIPVEDSLSKWRTVSGDGNTKLDLFYNAELDFNIIIKFIDAMNWSRLYGGAGLLLDVDDGSKSMIEPLNLKRSGKGCLRSVTVLDRYDIFPIHEIGVGRNKSTSGVMRDPIKYSLAGGGDVHPSRFIRFDGIKLPWNELQKNGYWGRSIVERIYDDALSSKTTLASIASMIFEANIDVVSVKGLFNMIMTGVGREKIIKRFSLANLTKSINKVLLIDAEEETFDRKSMNFAGLPALIPETLNVVAAAADIPITRFLGQSASGLNATGEGDLRNYYDMLTARRELEIAPQLRKMDEVLTRHVYGSKPENWSFVFNPLWSPSESEKATTNKMESETAEKYFNMGVIQRHHVAASLLESEQYNTIDQSYVDEIKAIEEMEIEEDLYAEENPMENPTNRDQFTNDPKLLQKPEINSESVNEENKSGIGATII